nr:hypothetical protein [Tanacetum cinerariifolium]
MPTIEEGEVIKEFRTRDEDLDTGINDYPSYCDNDKKIHIDCAHNLKFSCMIGFEFTHANFFPLLYVNVMSKKFHNSIMKDKMVYKGNNIVGALVSVPIFVGTFSVVTGFVVLENMDTYRDEGMGDVIFGEPFLREVRIKAKRFERVITIYIGNEEVTYQMVRSHPRFKRHTNEQCNKILPLLKEVILFYNGLDVPTRQILDSRCVVPTKNVKDAKKAIQEMAEYSQKWHNGTSKGRSTETSDGLAAIQAQLNNLGREIKKVNENVYAAQVGCEQCRGPHYTKDCPQKEERKTLEEAYYTQSIEDTLSKFMSESAKRHEENSNLIKEIRASTDAAIRNQGASIKTLEIQIRQMSKNNKLLYKSRHTTVPFPSRLDDHYCKEEEGNYEPKFVEAYEASHIKDTIP